MYFRGKYQQHQVAVGLFLRHAVSAITIQIPFAFQIIITYIYSNDILIAKN